MSPLLTFSLLFLFSLPPSNSAPCGERCGRLRLPFPFHLSPSCGPPVPFFRLTCARNSTLLLPLTGPTGPLPILSFLPSSSILLDLSNFSSDSADAIFDPNPFLGVTPNNVIRLYDCDDSSICNSRCDGGGRGCCYSLKDGSVWRAGDGFGVFKEFGCRGFWRWERGAVEVEWALPRGLRNGTECVGDGGVEVNAVAVKGGVRCACGVGFVGDGFAGGSGCFRASTDNRNATDDGNCCKGRLCKKKVAVIIGVLVSTFFIAAATACYFLLRSPPDKRYRWDAEQTCLPKIFAKACRARHFTYQELNEATKGFDQHQKLVDVTDGTIHPGVLSDGSLVAIQRMTCGTPQMLKQVLNRVELISQISHKNIARVIGFCISSSRTLLLVHESFPNGTLKDLLQPERESGPLNWYRRINIATEVASALAHLQSEVSPPIKPHNLRSDDIFVLPDYSVRIASFKLIVSDDDDTVRNFGLILLELIVGSKHDGAEEMVLDKIRMRRLEEIVDPCLRFAEQLPAQCEQIEKLAIFAVHCLSTRGLCMVGVAKEFICIVNGNMDGNGSLEPALEVTFSNSSLLQMISVSPDSLHVP